MSSKVTEALSKGVDTSTKNPSLFFPSLAPIVIQLLFLILAYVVFPTRYGWYPYLYWEVPNVWLIWGGYFIASIILFIALCMSVDMANDAINKRPMNMKKSMNLVTGKLGTLFLAAIIAGILSFTIILIPVALLIIVIAIIEGTDAIESTKRSFNFFVKNLGELIIFLIILIVVGIIVGIGFVFAPFGVAGALVSWILYIVEVIVEVVFIVAAVHFYLSLRAPPPPPPPPPT